MSSNERSWQELPKGAISYRSSMDYKTGDWGVSAPKIDYSRCTKCTLCHFFCPEGTIPMNEDGFPEVDNEYCKGCGICVKECPVQCIEMVRK